MRKIFKFTRMTFLTVAPFMLWAASVVYAQDGLLDDKVFMGRYTENHLSTVREEKLTFWGGELHSTVFAQRGFTRGVYTAVVKQDGIHFEAVTVSPEEGTIDWRGIVSGDAIAVKYQWRKKGWLTDTVRDYSFIGTIVK